MKTERHSAFITQNGINQSMGIYEQGIMNIHEEECDIVYQHTGKENVFMLVYNIQ